MDSSTASVLVTEMVQDDCDKLYERLVRLRRMSGMSAAEFADFIGITEGAYRAYEAKNPKYRAHMKAYIIDLIEYKLTMEGKLPGPNGNNILDWLQRIYDMLAASYEYRPERRVSFLNGGSSRKEN